MAGELITRTNRVVDLTTGTRVLTINDAGGTFTNLGSSSCVTFTLPAGCPVGLEFTFAVLVAEMLFIDTPPEDKSSSYIYYAEDYKDNLRANTIGHAITIKCVDNLLENEKFIVKSIVGDAWTTYSPE